MMYDLAYDRGGESAQGMSAYVVSQVAGTFNPLITAAYEQTSGKPLGSPLEFMTFPFHEQTRAPEVVPRRLQNLPPEQQYTSKTSQTARWFGSLWGASPVKVERLIKTFGAGRAADALALVDTMVYSSGLAEDNRPDDYFIMSKFVASNVPSYTKYSEQFYSQLETQRLNEQRGKENNYKELNKQNKKISSELKKYRDIENSKIDPKEKKVALEEQQRKINQMYKQAVQPKR